MYPGGHAFDYPFAVITTLTAGEPRQASCSAPALRRRAGGTPRRRVPRPGITRRRCPESGNWVDPSRPVELRPIDQPATDAGRAHPDSLRTEPACWPSWTCSGSMAKEVPGAGGATRLELAAQAATEDWACTRTARRSASGYSRPAERCCRSPRGRADQPGRGPADLQRRQPPSRRSRWLKGTPPCTTQRWPPSARSAGSGPRQGERRGHCSPTATDTDDNTVGLDALLQTLRSENDPARPVPVITIAFGPDADRAALSAISSATGGAATGRPAPTRSTRSSSTRSASGPAVRTAPPDAAPPADPHTSSPWRAR